MSGASPSDILTKLEELKKWQQHQQERLLTNHSRRLERHDFTVSERNFLQKSLTDSPPEEEPAGPQKSFRQIAHERLPSDVRPESKPRPFLRRGAGLARYRMTAGQQFQTVLAAQKSSSVSSNKQVHGSVRSDCFVTAGNNASKKSSVKSRECEGSKADPKTTTPLKRPNISMKASWASLRGLSNETALNNSQKELLVFEALENRCAQAGFNSANSSVVQLLASTPHKDQDSEVHIEEVVEPQDPAGGAFETIKTFRDNALKAQEIEDYEQKIHSEYMELIQKAMRFREFVTRDDLVSYTSSISSVVSEDLLSGDFHEAADTPRPPTKSVAFAVERTSSSSSNISSASSSQKFNDNEPWSDVSSDTEDATTTCEIVKCDAATMTNVNSTNSDRIDRETKKLERENAKVAKLKEQLEQQKREFERHKRELLKKAEDEKVQLNFTLEQERKKLAKEKMVFERYVKEQQSKPSKKERDELAALKSEVCALNETLKLKETKNGLAQARLRNQIKALEKENAALKDEAEKLNRQNGKLVASQRLQRRPSDTKMLHEINRNLSKLAKEKNSAAECEEVAKPRRFSKDDVPDGETARPKEREVNGEEKENDQNVTNGSFGAIEEVYNKTFKSDRLPVQLTSFNHEEIKNNDRSEKVLPDGSTRIEYKNGNVKDISPDGNSITFKYYNGDVKETNLLEGTVVYHYCESRVRHTTNADGSELIEFPDGQVEKRRKDGYEVKYPNGIVRKVKSDSTEDIQYPDGTCVSMDVNGDRTLMLPNGQKEIHTKEHKRREYPDGTVKILYPDGLQETRFGNGRIRIKDKNGRLLMDSYNAVDDT